MGSCLSKELVNLHNPVSNTSDLDQSRHGNIKPNNYTVDSQVPPYTLKVEHQSAIYNH